MAYSTSRCPSFSRQHHHFATACATLNCQLGFLDFSGGRQLDFSLRVLGPLQYSPVQHAVLWSSGLQQSLQRCYEFPVPRTLVTWLPHGQFGRKFLDLVRQRALLLSVPGSAVSLSVLPASWQFLECPHLDSSVWRVRATLGQASWHHLHPVSSALTCASDSRTSQLARPLPSFLSLKSASVSRTLRQAGVRVLSLTQTGHTGGSKVSRQP